MPQGVLGNGGQSIVATDHRHRFLNHSRDNPNWREHSTICPFPSPGHCEVPYEVSRACRDTKDAKKTAHQRSALSAIYSAWVFFTWSCVKNECFLRSRGGIARIEIRLRISLHLYENRHIFVQESPS